MGLRLWGCACGAAQVAPPDKITLFAKNPRGVVVVKFKTAFAAGTPAK